MGFNQFNLLEWQLKLKAEMDGESWVGASRCWPCKEKDGDQRFSFNRAKSVGEQSFFKKSVSMIGRRKMFGLNEQRFALEGELQAAVENLRDMVRMMFSTNIDQTNPDLLE